MRMKTFLFFIISLFCPIIVFGQAVLTGVIADSVSGEALIGASVIIQGTSIGCATDIEGKFRLSGIPEKKYNIKVSYIGYESQTIQVDFSATKENYLNVRLKPSAIQAEEIIVTAQLKGQLAAINQQVTSKTIVNVVSEERIQELPDVNAAEAIGRLPGVAIIRSGGEASQVVLRGLSSKFSSITVDGVKIPPTEENTRGVDLSMISQGSLAGIELFKAITPDQDGDAIAGAINFVTRKAPSDGLIRLDLKGNYNNIMKSANQYDATFKYGKRFFNDILGLQLQVNNEKKIRSKENIFYTYSYDNNPLLPQIPGDPNDYGNDYTIKDFSVRFTDELRTRNGVQAIIDFNTPDDGNIKLSSMYSATGRDIMLCERTYPAWGGSHDFNYEYTELRIGTFNASLQGANFFGGFNLDWLASFAESKTKNPYGYRLIFSSICTLPGKTKGQPEKTIIPFIEDNFAQADLDSSLYYKVDNYDKESTYKIDFSRRFPLSSILSTNVKVGGKYKEKVRWKTRRERAWNNYMAIPVITNPDGTPINFIGTRFEGSNSAPPLSMFIDYPVKTRNLLGLYKVSPLVPFSAFDQWKDLMEDAIFPTGMLHCGELGLPVLSDYYVIERVSSAYIMSTTNLGEIASLMIGARVEKESNKYCAKYSDRAYGGTGYVQKLSGAAIDTISTYEEIIWLPNVQLSFKPTDYLTLRAAVYKALARPDFNLRIPHFAFGAEARGIKLNAGNPKLKDAKSWNYELNTQIYDNTIGLFSISGFYKVVKDMFYQSNAVRISWPSSTLPPNQVRMGINGWTNMQESGICYRLDTLLRYLNLGTWKENPFFSYYTDPHSGLYSNFLLNIAYNSLSPVYVWGVEIEHQMNFSFLPVKWIRNFVLTYNLSITRSQTEMLTSYKVTDTLFFIIRRPGGRVDTVYEYRDGYIATFEKRESEDQPELYANIALGYDFTKTSIRLSFFYQDRYVKRYSSSRTKDNIVDEFIKWDLAVRHNISSSISFFLNVNNILNKKESSSVENKIFNWGYLPLNAELYGRTVDFGVRVEL